MQEPTPLLLAAAGPLLARGDWWQIRARSEAEKDEPTHAEVLIYAEIGESFWGESVTAKDFVAQLEDLPESVQTIDLRLNSPGGSVTDGRAIYNALKRHPAKVTAYVDGLAASMASEIMLASERVMIAENAFIMIHNPWGMAVGDAEEMRKAADLLDKMRSSMIKRYAAKSGRSEKEIGKAVDAETWFEGQEAVEFGLADEVYDLEQDDADVNAAALGSFDATALKHFHHPPARLVAALARGDHQFGRAASQPSTTATTKGDTMDVKAMARALGMSEDSTEEQVLARAAALRAQTDGDGGGGDDPAPGTDTEDDDDTEMDGDEPAKDKDGESRPGTKVVDADALAQLQADARAGREARDKQLATEREAAVKAAVRQGKIPAARAAHWVKQLEIDPGAKATLDSMEPGLIPVGELGSSVDGTGSTGDTQYGAADAYPEEWLSPAERRRKASALKAMENGSNPRIAYANEGA